MLTKEDLENIKFIVKKETKTIISEFEKLRDDNVVFKDEILHEIQNMRDDITVVIGYRDLIEDHEIRLTKIEKDNKPN